MVNLHNNCALKRCRNVDWNFAALLVLCLYHIEYRQDGRGNDEQGRVHEMTTGTGPLADPECQRDHWILSQASVFIEEPLRLERLWIWIYIRVVQNCPDTPY